MTKKKPRAKTAYEACLMAADAIEAEPLGYYQGAWRINRTGKNGIALPPCGAAYCRGGHLTLAAGYRLRSQSRIAQVSSDLLGVDDESQSEFATAVAMLFDGMALGPNWLFRLNSPDEYAKLGADGLRQFARRWRMRLQKRRIPRKSAAKG